MFRAEDGSEFSEGSLMFNYYDMRPVIVGREGQEGWFTVEQYDLPDVTVYVKRTILNGQRMCSLEYAEGRGFISEEQVSRFRAEHECPRCWSAPCHCE